MLWPHRIRVTYSIPFDPPQYNSHGNEIYTEVDKVVPGQVVPLGNGNTVNGGIAYTETRYKIMIAPSLELPTYGVAVTYEWAGRRFDAQGAAERHMLGGRLHHYEAVSRSLT